MQAPEDHRSSSRVEEAFVGLAAELYDLWYGPEAGADDHYQQQLAEDAGPVLEIGCGTGRQLLPALRARLDIEGVDNSLDMLAICRQKAEQAGLAPVLHQQDVRRLDLPRRYTTIFCAYGTFQLLADWDEALTALHRVYDHLTPGGCFLVDCSIPWHELTAPRRQWRLTEVVTRPDDGATVLEHEASEADPLRQAQTRSIRHEVYQRGQLTTRLRRLRLRWYGPREFQLMLETAGFRNVTSTADESINRSYYAARRLAATG